MASTLIVNPGSTSKKYALYHGSQQIFSMRFEETGDGFGVCREKNNEQQKCEAIEATTYKKALEHFMESAQDAGHITKKDGVTAVGVRVVAPGSRFAAHERITDDQLEALERQCTLAPAHVPAIVAEIYAVKALLPHVPLYGISDSAFHTSMPTHRRRIGIKMTDANEYDIARFGYHGLSVGSIARRAESFFGVAPDRMVVVHVGGGISATALHYKESVDTSMGYSPASGIMMGSRVGAFDADALVALMAYKGVRSIDTLAHYLNRESGFVGIVGNADMRLVLNKYTEGDSDAAEALEMLRYQLHRQIGGHVALLGGIDALVLTGTAVVRNPFLRAYLLDGLSGLGLVVDAERNNVLVGKEGMIHSDRAPVSIGIIKNDEMGEMARITAELSE